jgi:hypothetical protein
VRTFAVDVPVVNNDPTGPIWQRVTIKAESSTKARVLGIRWVEAAGWEIDIVRRAKTTWTD